MATLFGPVTGGTIIEPASVVPVDLAANGYLEDEFLASGTASGYVLEGEADPGGRWAAKPGRDAPFRTRVVVRRPADPSRFSGTVLLEWLNVSSGFDADPDWAFMHEEIFRRGHAYAAVSAQALGVHGGGSVLGFPGPPAPGLRDADPARYGTLHHPGDEYSFDIFAQVGAALGGGPVAALGGMVPERILALGESQSAFFLTAYINGVHPLTPVFDGFFVHSRGAGAAPLTGERINPPADTVGIGIRDDAGAPIMVFQAEGDVAPPLASGLARQPDSVRFRLWETAGTAHADSYLIGPVAGLLGCDWRINEGPHRFVAQAALRALHRWVTDGTPPPEAARLELAAQDPPVIARDAHGNALGGVRTPAVDVPVATLSGTGPADVTGPGWLVGATIPFDGPTLRRLYGDHAGYVGAYTRSLDAAIGAGFLLPEHRAELIAEAEAFAFVAS